jgi:dihydroceramidase
MPSITQERTGVWSPRTSSIDWCEDNYAVSPWVAEFWNTISNMSMILPSLYGLYSSIKEGLEARYVLSYFLFLLVGIGSTMFHMTLLYPMQLLDEIPMIYTTCVFIYSLAVVKKGPGAQDKFTMGILFLYALAFTFIYSVNSNPLIMEAMYGFLVFVLLYQAIKLVYYEATMTSIKLAITAVILYIVAFILWNIDNHFCPHLKRFRDSMSYPVGVISELHAWWHLLAGYSTYLHIVFSSHYRLLQLKRNPELVACPVGICVVKSDLENRI